MAEQALLGALLANNKAYERVADFLLPEHFVDPVNGRIFKAIVGRIDKGLLADGVTLKSDFENSGALDDVGGTRYLAHLMAAMVGVINATDYGRVIHDAWLRRQLIDIGTEIVNSAFESNTESDAAKQVELAERALFALTSGNASRGGPVSILDAVDLAIEEGQAIRDGRGGGAVSTGLPSLDRRVLRLRDGHLVVLAGRPGMGKSALAKNVAINVACGLGVTEDGEIIDDQSLGKPVGYFSLEETEEDIGASAISQIATVPVDKILSGDLTVDEASRVVKARKRYEAAPLFLFCGASQSVRSISSAARRLERKHGKLALIVADYLQLMDFPAGAKEIRLAVSQNAQDSKKLAKELKCPFLLLSQLSRKVEDRADKRPALSDLKESGAIEESADVAILLFREEYYYIQTVPKSSSDDDGLPSSDDEARRIWNEGLEKIANKAEAIVAKVKRGRPGVVNLLFNGAASRFEEEGRF